MSVYPNQRPRLRGLSHAVAAAATPFLATVLILVADTARERVGAAIFGAALVLLYTTSASYHWRGPLVGRPFMRRLDHALIFVLIAGTYTPLCLTMPHRAAGIAMLATIWSVATLGIVTKLTPLASLRWLGVTLYLMTGWAAVPLFPLVAAWLAPGLLALLVAGGVLYTLGAIIYATRRPNPFPRAWGFHENFHALVLAGTASHTALVIAIAVG